MWDTLAPIGRAASGGYRRFAWTPVDRVLREWFASEAQARGLDLVTDRAGNNWAWWGSPSRDRPGVVVGSHLDSVPDGGAFDGPLGVVSAFCAVDLLRSRAFEPSRSVGVACFGDEEGARFGVACAGSRLVTGALPADRGLALTDGDGVSMATAMRSAGLDPAAVGRDDEALRLVDAFIELHVEQGRGLVDLGRPIAVGSSILPHGRWRLDLAGEANHAGTTRLEDRRDPMLDLAAVVTTARSAAKARGCVATIGKVTVVPNGVNAIPSAVTAWLDARGDSARRWPRSRAGSRDRAGGGVVHAGHPIRAHAGDPALPPAGGRAGARHRSRPRRRHPRRRRCAGRDAVRPQPDRRLALAGRARRPGGLPGWRRGARRRASRSWPHDQLLGGARLAARRPRRGRHARGRRRALHPGRGGPAAGRPTRLAGVVLPGFADVHGHAFHRALRGRTHADGGTFWSWREAMYAVAARLDPDSYLSLARTTYRELARAGVSTVGEFHYLHHGPGGVPYQDPNAMAEALRQAATDAGVRLTLLDTCYLAGGLSADGYLPLEGVQRRFGDRDADAWAARVADLAPVRRHAGRGRGALGARGASPRTVHSGRCGRPAARPPVGAARGERGVPRLPRPHPDRTSRRARCALAARTTAVHGTHLTPSDVDTLARTGTGVCFCPSTEADLADGIGPAARSATRGSGSASAPTSTSARTCWPRRAIWRCTSGWPPVVVASSTRPS